MTRSLRTCLARLRRDSSGLAMVEFAITLPFMLGIVLAGTELTNFTITKMRMSQLALQIADSGSRIGTMSPTLSVTQISETQISDLLTGANMQSRGLNLLTNGRVIISSLEPDPNNAGKYYIHWQRCKGAKNPWPSTYGVAGQNSGKAMTGMGPTGRQVTAPTGGAVIYVEIAYNYKPIISSKFAPTLLIREVAAMNVRDKRDYTGIYTVNASGVQVLSVDPAASTTSCSLYSAT